MEKISFEKRMILLVGILLVVLFLSSFVSSYVRSNPQYTQPGLSSFRYLGQQGIDVYPVLDREKCGAGQDFIIQIAPEGCSPSVVRSDLLEEQNVPVFCPLMATKVNPLIDVEAINYITFSGQDKPDAVSGVGFHPAQAALGSSSRTILNSPTLENIGYAVVVLKRQESEADMDDWVEGTMTANLKYDIKNAFGIGKATYYLSSETDDEWRNNYHQYGFWNGKGYLKVESIDNSGATISVYRDKEHKISTANLQEGELSQMIYMPGYYCLAGMQLRLDDLEAPDTRVKLEVNGDVYEVADGEKFLDNKCQVTDLENSGLNKEVTIRCNDDNRIGKFGLDILPNLELEIGEDVGEYRLGDILYEFKDSDKRIFLGYVGRTSDNKDFIIPVVSTAHSREEFLESAIVASLPSFANLMISQTGSGWLDIAGKGLFGTIFGTQIVAGSAIVTGDYPLGIISKKGEDLSTLSKVFNTAVFLSRGVDIKEVLKGMPEIKFNGVASPYDRDRGNDFQESFRKAEENYRQIIEQFPEDKNKENKEYAEQGLYELIKLAQQTEQKATMIEFCKEFKEKYSDSDFKISFCDDEIKNANSGISSQNLVIDGRFKSISFLGITEPSFKEYGVQVIVSGAGGYSGAPEMRKNDIYYLSDEGEFFELTEVGEDYIKIHVEVKSSGIVSKVLWDKKDITIDLKRGYETIGGTSNFKISIGKINLENQAKVSVIPNIQYAETKAEFNFKIGIEKRNELLKLSPDEIKERILGLDDKIEQWDKISSNLGKTVDGLKTACIATGFGLTLKNILSNKDGKAIARKKVMRGEDGWHDYCLSNKERYGGSMDKCFLENADKIESDVDSYAREISEINEEIEGLHEKAGVVENFFGQVSVDEEKLQSLYLENVKNDLPEVVGDLDMVKVREALTIASLEDSNFNMEDLRNIQLYSSVFKDNELSSEIKETAKNELDSLLTGLVMESADFIERSNTASILNLDVNKVGFLPVKDARKIPYEGVIYSDIADKINLNIYGEGIQGNTPLYIMQTSTSEKYIFILDDSSGTNKLPIKKFKDGEEFHIYDINGNFISSPPKEITNIYFQKYDSSEYENEFKDPIVRYHESGKIKGYPGLVPFDLKRGFYVYDISFYDSAEPYAFTIGNIGSDGRVDLNNDDAFYISTGKEEIFGLGDKSGDLINLAKRAIEQAKDGYKKGVTKVSILGQGIKVGEPMANVPDVTCQDFMSPKECNLLFNVCDPVICPPSRCDLGGRYVVDDVIKTGVVGGIALCLPNWNEGIFVPVCLTGIREGIDNYNSMAKSYRACLQESLDTGKQIGICDEIHSIYACEFFWRQAAPFSKLAIPKVLEIVTGQGTKGGGEYLGIRSAWENAESSVDYLRNYFSSSSQKAFSARSTEEIGTPVCKNFVSLAFPGSSEIIDSLGDSRSPTQFNAWFDEIPFTTSTSPPISQYKVFYHIYAGRDIGSYYRVYLKDPEGSSFYQETQSILVASGYVGVGEFVTETKDFTAPSGYKKLCVTVNSQETCGFKRVTTDFALNFVEDKYLTEQASERGITKQKECIGGSSSWYSMIGGNLQEGVDEVLNPDLGSRGIVRVCATQSPGKSTDALDGTTDARWQEVGYCDNENMKCWLDTQSVRENIKDKVFEGEALKDFTGDYIEGLKGEEFYLKEDKYEDYIGEFEKVPGIKIEEGEEAENWEREGLKEVISIIGEIYEKVIMSNQKVQLLDFRARAWNKIARLDYEDEKTKRELTKAKQEEEKEEEKDVIGPTTTNNLYYQKLIADEIIELALEKKKNLGDIDADLQNEGVANSFENLILQIAMQETRLQHCDKVQEDGDALYCDGGDLNNLIRGGNDYGVMQINLDAHPEMKSSVSNFEKNVEYGMNVLIKGYSQYKDGKEFKGKTYTGWKAALRSYNGWGEGGDDDYVENVILWRSFVENQMKGENTFEPVKEVEEEEWKHKLKGDSQVLSKTNKVYELDKEDIKIRLKSLNMKQAELEIFKDGDSIDCDKSWWKDRYLEIKEKELKACEISATERIIIEVGSITGGTFFGDPLKVSFKLEYQSDEEVVVEGEEVVEEEIKVNTLEEFVNAIKPNTKIIIPEGVVINIGPKGKNVSEMNELETDFVKWETSRVDGEEPEIVISNINNLIIKGEENAEIISDHASAWVLNFEDANSLILDNLIMGHSVKVEDICDGGVVLFRESKDIKISNSELYGSGTTGVLLDDVENFDFFNSIIRETTETILSSYDSKNIIFRDSYFLDLKQNEESGAIYLRNSQIDFQDVVFKDNSFKGLFWIDSNSLINVEDCVFNGNKGSLFYGESDVSKITFSESKVINSPEDSFTQEDIDNVRKVEIEEIEKGNLDLGYIRMKKGEMNVPIGEGITLGLDSLVDFSNDKYRRNIFVDKDGEELGTIRVEGEVGDGKWFELEDLEGFRIRYGDYNEDTEDFVFDIIYIKQEKEWTLNSAVVEIKTREGDYSDNKDFIDNLYKSEILTEEEYKEINGEGIFNLEEDMEYVLELLEEKRLDWAIEEIRYREGDYSDNKQFIDELYEEGIITEEEYKEINGEGIFNLEEDMDYVLALLESKKKETPKLEDEEEPLSTVEIGKRFAELPLEEYFESLEPDDLYEAGYLAEDYLPNDRVSKPEDLSSASLSAYKEHLENYNLFLATNDKEFALKSLAHGYVAWIWAPSSNYMEFNVVRMEDIIQRLEE